MERTDPFVIPVFQFPTTVTIALDVMMWGLIHIGVAWFITQQKPSMFMNEPWYLRLRRWETPLFYETLFRIKVWKPLLPDAAPWFNKGFSKKNLNARDANYLKRFVLETRRGELSHWICLCCSVIFFLWNALWVSGLMVCVGIIFNLPCILVQRYNRLRLINVINKY